MGKLATIIFIIFAVVSTIVWICLFAKYANTPIGEMPTWVYYILFDNGK